jgi:hypothetical protein
VLTSGIREKVRAALHGGWVLAPTSEQRLEYHYSVRVWGKDKIKVPAVMQKAFEQFNVFHFL